MEPQDGTEDAQQLGQLLQFLQNQVIAAFNAYLNVTPVPPTVLG
jgi:hypothetical protein